MAIPISKYIDIGSTVIGNTIGERDLSGLVFTDESMLATVPADYTAIKTSYAAGHAVALTYNGVVACFGATSRIAKFAARYFGYRSATSSPKVLNVAKFTAGSESTAYAAVIAEFTNFGSFTFLNGNITNLATIAATVAANKQVMIVAVDSTTSPLPTTFKLEGVHCVLGGAEYADGAVDYKTGVAYSVGDYVKNGSVCYICDDAVTALENTSWSAISSNFTADTAIVYAAWMPMAWFASVNYDLANASSTIDYKEFDDAATVTTGEGKETADAARMNYIGQVQIYGAQRKFYQKGLNGDGIDLGVYRDKMWLESSVEIGWFNLVGGVNKIPANDSGVAQVYAMIVGIAQDSVDNGIILKDKPLSNTAIQQIQSYTTDPNAVNSVQTLGYFVAATLVQDGDTYVCQYQLIYAKGDHIGKVEGSHVVV